MDSEQHRILDLLLAGLEAEHAVLSPGSRNAPVMSAILRNGYRVHSVVDERSAGFQALGMAKSLRQAVVLSCTSGTAALNYYPAIAEAYYARIPLIVITADRPAHLVDQWVGQTIRQSKVFQSHCRLSLDLDLDRDRVNAALEQISETLNSIRGPIHINLPLVEPLYAHDHLEPNEAGRRYLHNDSILLLDIDDYLPEGRRSGRIMVLNGMEDGQILLCQCRNNEDYDGLLILSDLTANQASSIPNWDAMLFCGMRNAPDRLAHLRPEILITTGTFSVSKGIHQFLKTYPPLAHFHISRHSEVGDPFGTSPVLLDPYEPSAASLPPIEVDPAYHQQWNAESEAFTLAWHALDWEDYNEFSVVRQILGALPPSASLHLGNSMPIRYASFLANELDSLEVFSNRGTSGIDGCVSTAIGHAQSSGEEVYLIVGDLSFQYDSNAFDQDRLPNGLKVIVLNNGGGRIFDFIDGAGGIPERQAIQVSARKRDFESLCSHFGLEYFCARDREGLQKGLDRLTASSRCSVLEVQTDPELNKAFYERVKGLNYE